MTGKRYESDTDQKMELEVGLEAGPCAWQGDDPLGGRFTWPAYFLANTLVVLIAAEALA